jgi:hypothetical protein
VVLDDNIILQADAVVIAGSLVLLTILYTLIPDSEKQVWGKIRRDAATQVSIVIIIIVILFSASVGLMILGDISGSYTPILLAGLGKYTITLTNLGKYVMISGFVALAIGILWLSGNTIKLARYKP